METVWPIGDTLGDSGGQGSLVCCSSWGCKQPDATERLNIGETQQTFIQQRREAIVIKSAQVELVPPDLGK